MKTYQFAISLGLLFSAQPAYSDEETILIIKLGFYTINKLAEYFGGKKKDVVDMETTLNSGKAGAQQDQPSTPVTVNVQPTREPTPLEQADQMANVVGTGVVAAKAAASLYGYLRPSEAEKLREAQAKKELQKLTATAAARECFVKQRKTLKDADNIPYLCKEKFEEFVVVATAQEVDEVKKLINLK